MKMAQAIRTSNVSATELTTMAYWFAGFFARPSISQPNNLPADATWREIVEPFAGIGVRFTRFEGKPPPESEVDALAEQLGLNAAECWLFLDYACWAGRIDSVYGLGSRGGMRFGPLYETGASEMVDATFTKLMSQIDVSPEKAMRFAPFERGYWGNARLA